MRPRRSLHEAALALAGDDQSPWDRWCDQFEKRLLAAGARRTGPLHPDEFDD